MPSASSIFSAILVALAAVSSSAFAPSRRTVAAPPSSLRAGDDDGERQWAVGDAVKESWAPPPIDLSKFNPLAELAEMASNFDDVLDDFMNKRMGNGEVFYGKRKYKPSGRVTSDYNGGGLSDIWQIEAAREFREERKRMREEAMREEAMMDEMAAGRKNLW